MLALCSLAAEEYKKPSTARLDEQLAQLVEFLAENAHEQWAGALLIDSLFLCDCASVVDV